MKVLHRDSLSEVQRKAFEKALDVMKNSYNPYSNFPVGACLYRKRGRFTTFVTGTNCENASYGLTICAERTAFVRANAMGERDFQGIVVIGGGNSLTGPCGACRQFIQEFSELSTSEFKVVMCAAERDEVKIATAEDILPESFGPRSLGVDLKKYR